MVCFMIPKYKPLKLIFEMEESAKVILADSHTSKFIPERFVFWNVEINQSGLKYAHFLLLFIFLFTSLVHEQRLRQSKLCLQWVK